ncbi:hypothetical protein FRC05_007794 [Tulasnella sp. 425]|nr:hypothetical protein FRC05_007794 [Tulasnella sp. 425]
MHDVNFVHTSDIHSWYLGHSTNKTEWDVNIGDVVTFVEYLRKTGAPRGQDVIFVDTGDQTHGGGLSDADKPEGAQVRSIEYLVMWCMLMIEQALLLHTSLPYDILSPGNHELEKEPVARHLFEMLESHPEIKEKYLAANVFYKPPNEPRAKRQQLGSTHRTWHTESGRKITAIGVMFENQSKTINAGVYIDPVDTIVNETWFREQVLTSDPDVFLLVGHMSLSGEERLKWRNIHKAIREQHPHTPIFIFAGHTHQRECIMGINGETPVRSLGIESGRYLETVGWVGYNLTPPEQSLELSRMHIEARRKNLIRLTGSIDSVFAQSSENVMKPFRELAWRFGLDQYIGCLKNSYPWDTKRYEEGDPLHALNLYRNVAFPEVVPPKDSGPYALLLNNGFIRGPLYAGTFTLNDKFVNTPYDSQPFLSTKVPKMVAEKVAKVLLEPRPKHVQSFGEALSEDSQRPIVQGRYMRRVTAQDDRAALEESSCDALGPSTPLPQLLPHKYLSTFSKGFLELDDGCKEVDFVTLEFLKDRAHPVIEKLIESAHQQCNQTSTGKPVWQPYGTTYSGDVIKDWVQKRTVTQADGTTKCADQ